MICAKKQMQDIFGLTHHLLTKLEKQGLPVTKASMGKANTYDTVECINWLIAREISDRPGGDSLVYDSDQELGRLRNSQANKAEIEVKLLEGSVRLAEEVQLENGLIDNEIRQALLSLPARLSPKLIKYRTVKEMTAALKTDIVKTLDKLSRSADDEGGYESLTE